MSQNAREWDGDFDPLDSADERKVLFSILNSFRQYGRAAHSNVTHRRRQNFYALKTYQWQTLAAPPFDFLSTLDRVDEAIDANADIASEILSHGLSAFGLDFETRDPDRNWQGNARPQDLDKARTTINHFYRDWSAESFSERNTCNGPVLNDIETIFGHVSNKSDVRILVPGAGLGRLVFDLCNKGFTVEGNEISYHQLLASNWVLNHVQQAKKFKLYPFASNFSNLVSREHQLQAVDIPDIHPGTELEQTKELTMASVGPRMSMSAGDFTILYGNRARRESFDAVATVFFIDTAPNFIRYIEVVHNCLKIGGLWTNVGPLLWHFGDRAPIERSGDAESLHSDDDVGIDEPGSVELTVEEVLLLIQQMGFVIEKQEIRDGAGYIQNPGSLLHNVYRLSHWVARKV